MTNHAIAMVKWDVFRPSKDFGGVAVYDYGSNQSQLLKRVSEGGTLWLVTSRKIGRSPMKYHLAYKLVNCTQVASSDSSYSRRWKYVVRARDRAQSRHFAYNDITETLRRLEFESGKPISAGSNIGLRLLSIPELTKKSIGILERAQNQLENGRSVFISYSHEDCVAVSLIETELNRRNISSNRDVTFLYAGQIWEEALEQKVRGCDCFIVLISPAAGMSEWVKKEVKWALSEYKENGLVKAIVPIVLSTGGWEKFPELHHIHHFQCSSLKTTAEDFDKLAYGIVAVRNQTIST